MKKTVSVLLAFIMILLIIPAGVESASAAQDGDFTYEVIGSHAAITLYTGNAGDVNIPKMLGGYPVTVIGGSAFRECLGLTSVNIPYGVAEISDRAFSSCLNLKAVTIPGSVTSIGNYSFYHCTNLMIYCKSDSFAHSYANDKKINHEPVLITASPDYPGCVIDYAGGYIYGLAGNSFSPANCFNAETGYELAYSATPNGFGTGAVVHAMLNTVPVKSYTIIVFGDVNGDGLADSMDAGVLVDVENYMRVWDTGTDAAYFIAGDVNRDSRIDSVDAGAAVDNENYILPINHEKSGPPAPPRVRFKNVIFLIGDGMGENHLLLTKQELGISLIMETIQVRGQAETRSSNNTVTDSAAAATALACGVRTANDSVGVYPDDLNALNGYPVNLTSLADEINMKTGIVTTDLTTGATPAGFSAHSSLRSNTKDIALQEIAAGIDLFWGAADSETKQALVEANGYNYISTLTEMNALVAGERSFGQFNSNDIWRSASTNNTPTLSLMTAKAISQLDGEKGFFLMIEGAHIDKFSHNKDVANTVACVREFDKSVEIALNFAKTNPNTLVVVTADHETGAVKLVSNKYAFTSGSHSGVNVPLFVFGSDTFVQNNQAIKNTDVAANTAKSMGFTQQEFPYKFPKYMTIAA